MKNKSRFKSLLLILLLLVPFGLYWTAECELQAMSLFLIMIMSAGMLLLMKWG
jgi:hypothetical protein